MGTKANLLVSGGVGGPKICCELDVDNDTNDSDRMRYHGNCKKDEAIRI
jgi:hypothetical protein